MQLGQAGFEVLKLKGRTIEPSSIEHIKSDLDCLLPFSVPLLESVHAFTDFRRDFLVSHQLLGARVKHWERVQAFTNILRTINKCQQYIVIQ